MPKLYCGVENCTYNAEHCCCLGKVDVDGSEATDCTEGTCCNSFVEDNGVHSQIQKSTVRQKVVCIMKTVNAMQKV